MKWIKTSEQLPPKDREFIGFISNSYWIFIWVGGKYLNKVCIGEEFQILEKDVSHEIKYWCDLPKLPIEQHEYNTDHPFLKMIKQKAGIEP